MYGVEQFSRLCSLLVNFGSKDFGALFFTVDYTRRLPDILLKIKSPFLFIHIPAHCVYLTSLKCCTIFQYLYANLCEYFEANISE